VKKMSGQSATTKWYDRFVFSTQISAIFLFGIVVVGLMTSVLLTRVSSSIIYEHQVKQGLKVTEFIARQAEAALLFQSADVAADIAGSAIDLPDVQGIKIVTHELQELFATGSEFPEGSLEAPPAESTLVAQNQKLWIFSAPVYSEQGEANQLVDSSRQQRFLLGYISILFAKDAQMLLIDSIDRNNKWAAGGLVIFLFVLLWVSKRAMRPIQALSRTMTSARGNDDVVMSEVNGPRDIAQMQEAYNSLMLDLQKRRNELKDAAATSAKLAKTKSEFAANVTHELRTPLGAVLGMLDLLLTTGMSSKQKEYLEAAYSSGQGLLHLIDEVLSFSEVEAGKMEIMQQECHLAEILDEVIGLLASKALKKPIGIGYVIHSDLPSVVIADAGKLRQMLINLLGNAVKFTETGEVSVYVERGDAPTSEDAEYICFRVKDDGIGIDPKDHQQIFEAFLQVDSSSTKAYEGTGLGLTIVQNIAKLMGGRITLSSRLGAGSEFALTLPVKLVNQSVQKVYSKQLADRVFLLVTQSSVIRDFVSRELQSLGSDVVVAESKREAIKQVADAESGAFHAVFVDEDLEGISVADFLSSTQDRISFKGVLSVVFTNPYFSSYHLDGLQAVRVAKPLNSTALKQVLFSYFLPDQYQPQQFFKGIDIRVENAVNVLIIEDNRVNQQVAEAMLHKLGCSCEVVANGRLGVERVVYGNFDLVLMDCNMPILNGYAATQQIRDFEAKGAGGLPIIAMTANNSDSERNLCIEAGMNDFMPKPLSLLDMRDMLAKWTPFSAVEVEAEEDEMGSFHILSEADKALKFSELSYDPQALNQIKDVVGSSVHTMIKDLCLDMAAYLDNLKSAIAEGNASEIRYIAHTIKGVAKNFGARELIELSSQLEKRAEQGEFEGAGNCARDIADAVATLSTDLNGQTPAAHQLTLPPDGFEARDRVLVVDDDRSSRTVLAEAIRLGGCEVEEAEDGLKALDICRRHMPDLILMDAIMPSVSGFEACREIRKMPYGADIPILIITAFESEKSIDLAFSVAATDYINKPVNISVIRRRVDHLIASNKTERQMKQLAYHDSLTGLPNRTNLMQHLQRLIDQSKIDHSIFAVLFLDLDHFKVVNDSMGHDAGDLLLKAVSERLRSYVRGQDFIARLGGDEFTIVLENIRCSRTAKIIAEKICESLSRPFIFMRREMLVTSSVGISIFPDNGENITDLVKHADSAMFKAKSGRNGFCFYESGMETEIGQRLEMERDLRKAIEQDELLLFYQPKIDLKTGALLGAEALLRWQHPAKGLIGPDAFIPVAEESDLIATVNDWVLQNGMKQLCTWLANGHQLTLSLNLSLKGSIVKELQSRILTLTQLYQLPKGALELEITESALMNQPELIGVELSKIRELGIKIALDDFGSGYSSLNHLKQLPVDVLKIDRLFISDIETDPNDSAIVESIVCLARALRLVTVAEGVETEGQKKILSRLNCDCFQGYLASKPITSKQFERQFLCTG